MSLAFDDYGRPFIIIRDQDKKQRVKGAEAHKVTIIFADSFLLKKYSLIIGWKMLPFSKKFYLRPRKI